MGLSRSFTGSCSTRPVTVFFPPSAGPREGEMPWLRPCPFPACFFGIAAPLNRDKLFAARSYRPESVQDGAEKTNEPCRIFLAACAFDFREKRRGNSASRGSAAHGGGGHLHGAQPDWLAADGRSGRLAIGRAGARQRFRLPGKHSPGPDWRGGGRLAVRTTTHHGVRLYRRARRGHRRGGTGCVAGARPFRQSLAAAVSALFAALLVDCIHCLAACFSIRHSRATRDSIDSRFFARKKD